jgi:hypothetical protein
LTKVFANTEYSEKYRPAGFLKTMLLPDSLLFVTAVNFVVGQILPIDVALTYSSLPGKDSR